MMTNMRLLIGLGFAVGVGVLVYLLAPILMPFLVGALFAYLGQPLVAGLTRRRLPRVAAAIVVFALFIAAITALLVFLIPTIQYQIVAFTQRLPRYLDWLQHEALPWIESVTGAELALDMETLRQALAAHWQEMGGWLKASVAYVMQSGLRLVGWLVSLVLIPVVTFYLLLDWDRLLARIAALFPAAYRSRLRQLALETDAVLGGFLRGQFSVMLALAAFYSAGLWLIGLDLALPIGITAGLLSFVPYLGFLTGLVSAAIGAWVQFQDAHMLLWLAVLFGLGQALEGLVLTPRLVGERTGLHPVAVIFAVMAGGQLFGFTGVLLALPAAAVLKVWLRHLHEYYVPPSVRRRSRRSAP